MKTIVSICVLLMLSGHIALAAPVNDSKIQVEILGGINWINPKDLNGMAGYGNGYINDYSVPYYQSRDVMGGHYNGHVSGELGKINQSLPLGVRLKFKLDSRVSLSAGVKFLNGDESSAIQYAFDVTDLDEMAMSEVWSVDLHTVFFEGWVPMLGFHYNVVRSGLFNLEGFVSGGVVIVNCGISYGFRYQEDDGKDYRNEEESLFDMRGSGIGLAMEGGIHFRVRLAEFLSMITECGFTLQQIKNVTGDIYYRGNFKDSLSDGYREDSSYSGRWCFNPEYRQGSWGSWTGMCPGIGLSEGYGARFFELDLSGFFLRIGLSIEF